MKISEKPTALYQSQEESALCSTVQTVTASVACGPATVNHPPFQSALMRHYGFERSTADLISRVWSKAEEQGANWVSGTHANNLAAAYVFFRCLGGFCYNGSTWDYTAGHITGLTDDYEVEDGLFFKERLFFIGNLDFEDAEYRLLRYKVRVQHELSAKASTPFQVSFCERYNEMLQDNMSPECFQATIWNEQNTRMSNKPDFAHFCITVATQLATQLGFDLPANLAIEIKYGPAVDMYGVDTAREYFAGWLGDLILDDHTCGADDYAADADALEIMGYLETRQYDVSSSIQDCLNPYALVPKPRKTLYQSMLPAEDTGSIISALLFGDLEYISIAGLIVNLETYYGFDDVARFCRLLIEPGDSPTEEPLCQLYTQD